jgi:LEA14-like dessication related protein
MRRFERSLLLVALGAGLLTAACLGRVRQPEITLTGVKVSGLGLRGGSLLAELEIKNPNSFEVETRSITYDLKVADRSAQGESWIDFAKGEFTEPVKVGDGEVLRVEVPIEFTYSALGGALRSIMDRGAFDYRVEGVVALREPIRTRVPYRHSGNISLQGVR